ncbi:unnamed protein product, partial [marine sediment metagenome]
LNDINDSDGAPFWNKITKLLTQLLKSLGIDVQPNSLLATALEETMSLINSNNNTVKTEFTDGKPEFAVDPNVAFKIGDIVEYKGEQGTVERVRTDIVNGIGVRLPDGNLRDIKPSNLAFISSAPQTSEVEALEKARDKELLANNSLKIQDLKTKTFEEFRSLKESKNFLLEKYKGDEVIEFMINNLYDVNPGSNAYVDLSEWQDSEISELNLKNNKLEEALKFNFPNLTSKQLTDILSPVSENIFLEHKG